MPAEDFGVYLQNESHAPVDVRLPVKRIGRVARVLRTEGQ